MTSISTNIMNKSKAQIILELVESLNKGDSGPIEHRVKWAVDQYDRLVKLGIIKEEAANAESTM